MQVEHYLKNLGYYPAPQLDKLELWMSWYQGHVEAFHKYSQYNGSKIINRTRESMQMAKRVCEDWAALLLNEKVSITTPDARLQTVLGETLQANRFGSRANHLIELMMALGTAAFVEHLNAGEIVIDYVRAQHIYPLRWENGCIVDCAFASLVVIDGKKRVYVNIHERETGGYRIRNRVVDQDGKEVDLPEGLEPEILTYSTVPRFQIIKPNAVNNIDLDSPYGISIFANAISHLKKVDLIFDSGNNEFQLGKKRIIVPLSMTQIKVGEAAGRPVFDANDVAFYGLNVGATAEELKPIDLTGNLRIDEHSRGLQDALNYLSDAVGLGEGRFEYSRSAGVKTATEVVSENSTLWRNLCRHELVIEDALRAMVRALADMSGLNPDAEVSINFDDSVIQDTAAIQQQALLEYQAGLIDEVVYFQRVHGLTEEDAQQMALNIQARRSMEEPEAE